MNSLSRRLFVSLAMTAALALPCFAQEAHVGNLTGHAAEGKKLYRRYCVGCHGVSGDGNGENAPWIDPKPRDFVGATFKCRSTPTGTLPTDQDLYNAISRGFYNSNMPHWTPCRRRAGLTWSPTSRASRPVGTMRKPAHLSRFLPSPPLPRRASRTEKSFSRRWNAGSATARPDAVTAPPLLL